MEVLLGGRAVGDRIVEARKSCVVTGLSGQDFTGTTYAIMLHTLVHKSQLSLRCVTLVC